MRYNVRKSLVNLKRQQKKKKNVGFNKKRKIFTGLLTFARDR